MIGTIELILEGATLQETEHCRKMIEIMMKAGVFNVRSGQVVINFDYGGEIGDIEIRIRKYKKDYSNMSRQ